MTSGAGGCALAGLPDAREAAAATAAARDGPDLPAKGLMRTNLTRPHALRQRDLFLQLVDGEGRPLRVEYLRDARAGGHLHGAVHQLAPLRLDALDGPLEVFHLDVVEPGGRKLHGGRLGEHSAVLSAA